MDFYFRKIDSRTCYIGSDGDIEANAAVLGTSYCGPAIIPSIAIDSSDGKRYKVVTTLKYSFRGCTNLKHVTLPNTLKRIEWDSFYRTAIEYIFIPKSVEIIQGSGLSHMQELKTIVFEPGSKLSKIGNLNFNSDNSLSTVVLPPSLKSIEHELFYCVTSHIKLVYCGKNEMTAQLFSNGNDITVYVTKEYKGKKFGDIDVSIIQDDDYSCAPYLLYYKPHKYTCKRSRERYSLNIFLVILVSSTS